MAVGDTNVFSGFLKPVLTQLFFSKPPTAFLTYLLEIGNFSFPKVFYPFEELSAIFKFKI